MINIRKQGLSNRIGVIKTGRQFLTHSKPELLKLFEDNFNIIHKHKNPEVDGGIVLYAMSKHFDVMEPGDDLPEYNIHFEYDQEKGISLEKVEKINKK